MKVTFLLGSESDKPHAEKIAGILDDFNIPHETVVASAHKVPEKVIEVVQGLNDDPQPQVIITVVGMSNGLGGVVAGSCIHPVVNCPPFKNTQDFLADINSSLRMPSQVPVMTVCNAKNAGLSAVKILAETDADLKEKVKKNIEEVKSSY